MRKPIKTRTYYNFMRVRRMIEAKGYNAETASELTRRIFDDYEAAPTGLSILSRVDMILTKADYDAAYNR